MLRNRSGQEHTTATYEDWSNLLTTLGVIFALLLTFLMTIVSVMPQTSLATADFFWMLCSRSDFRDFAVMTLANANYNFSFPETANSTLDIRTWLANATLYGPQLTGFFPGAFYDCAHDQNLSAIAELFKGIFPMDHLRAWFALHREVPRVSTEYAHYYAMCSLGLAIAGLIGVIVLYLSLQLSPSHEDSTGHSIKVWLCYSSIIVIGLVVILAASIVTTLFTVYWFIVLTADDYATLAQIYGNICGQKIIPGLTLPAALAACMSLVMSCKVARAKFEKFVPMVWLGLVPEASHKVGESQITASLNQLSLKVQLGCQNATTTSVDQNGGGSSEMLSCYVSPSALKDLDLTVKWSGQNGKSICVSPESFENRQAEETTLLSV